MTFASAPPINMQTLFSIPAIGAFESLAPISGAPATVAHPLANLALYVPFSVSLPVTVLEGWVVTGATAGGNFDIGVYDEAGVRLSSSGSTARTANAVDNTTAFTNLDLFPDRYYYMALSHDGTNNFFAASFAAGIVEAHGVLESTSSFVLPTNPTLVRTTRAYVPHFGLNLKAVSL